MNSPATPIATRCPLPRIGMLLGVVGASMLFTPATSIAADRYLRPNQAGYGTNDPKTARALSHTNVTGASVRVLRVPSGTVAYTTTLSGTNGAWGTFGFTHKLDFSALTETGLFRLQLVATGETSPNFPIGDANTVAPGYEPISRSMLSFLGVQRCGPTSPIDHDVCHLLDAHHIVGGPQNGQSVNVSGGWHDAGDYIKFLTTVAYATHFLLWADELRPNLAGDWNGNGTSDLLDEAKIGARFLLKLRYQPGRFLYQVSDEADHEQGERLPEDDTLTPVRPAYYGAGKNHLGRYVATLARAARAYAAINPGLADSCLAAAIDAQNSIASAPNLVSNSGFYPDDTWHDKLALGAIELYLTTQQMGYLNTAKAEADLAGTGWWAGWGTVNGLAHALLAPYHAPSLAHLQEDLDNWTDQSNTHPFGMAGTEVWGINMVLTQMAAEALLYERLTGLATYAPLAYTQREFLLGANPWGVCFVGGLGGVSPQDFHHQIADIVHGGAMPGALAEGPAPLADIQGTGIILQDPDEYAEFQDARGTYHDDHANYVTNEPGLTGNGSMLFMLALFAGRGVAPAPVEPPVVLTDRSLVLYPNPWVGDATLRLAVDGARSTIEARVIDLSGRAVSTVSLYEARTGFWSARLGAEQELSSGTYWIVVDGVTPLRVTRLARE